MTRILPSFLVLALLLGALPGASAWHWEDENENTAFGSQAGDPRTVEDAGECLEEVQDREELACMVLYPHIWDDRWMVPVNTQRPADCLGDVESSHVFDFLPGNDEAESIWFSSPGFAEYATQEDGNSCEPEITHPERGLTRDLVLSPESNITGYWYLASGLSEPSAPIGSGQALSAGSMPCMTVEFTMRNGKFTEDGDVIAHGSTTKTIVSTPGGTDPDPLPIEDPCPGSLGTVDPGSVTEFRVDLGTPQFTVPQDKGFIVLVHWYQWNPEVLGEDLPVKQSHWKVLAGPEHANRLTVPVVEPLSVDGLDLQEEDGSVQIRSIINSPMGSYDVDVQNIRVEVFDDAEEKIDLKHLQEPILRYSVDIGGHFRPVNVTFPWDLEKEDLDPGTYTVRMSATNWQHTHDAMNETTFTIPAQAEVQGSPGAGFPVIALLLLTALVLRRRT